MTRHLRSAERLLAVAWLFGPAAVSFALGVGFAVAGLGAIAICLCLGSLALAAVGFSRL